MDSILQKIQKLPDAREMGIWDKTAINFGIPQKLLMENAGRRAFEQAVQMLGTLQDRVICLFMGSGNNGGDAAAMARHILDAGGMAKIISLRPLKAIRGASGWHLKLALKNGAIFKTINLASLTTIDKLIAMLMHNNVLPALIVDGILGTGLSSLLKPGYENFINFLNHATAGLAIPVLALDIPSGLDSRTGQPLPVAVKASRTITFQAPKPGLLMPGAKYYTGKLYCKEIGIPQAVKLSCPSLYHQLDGRALKLFYASERPVNSFKNKWGHVCIIGGSGGYSGAAHLAALAALRMGAGLVTVLAPRGVQQLIKSGLPEIMTCTAGPGEDWPEALNGEVEDYVKKCDALVIGPGMGLSDKAASFANKVLRIADRPPAVLDADILRLAATGNIDCDFVMENDILTPHPGEAGYLLGKTGGEIQADRQSALTELCNKFPGSVVLKGACTLIGQGKGKRALCPYDIAQLSIAGAGDVLAGCIGAMLASRYAAGWTVFSRACFGVVAHALAGLQAARKYPNRGALASQVASELAHIDQLLARKHDTGEVPWPSC